MFMMFCGVSFNPFEYWKNSTINVSSVFIQLYDVSVWAFPDWGLLRGQNWGQKKSHRNDSFYELLSRHYFLNISINKSHPTLITLNKQGTVAIMHIIQTTTRKTLKPAEFHIRRILAFKFIQNLFHTSFL